MITIKKLPDDKSLLGEIQDTEISFKDDFIIIQLYHTNHYLFVSILGFKRH